MPNINEISMAKNLTPALAHDSRMVSVMEAVDKELKEIAVKQYLLYIIANIEIMPEVVINLLAWQWHVDFWDDSLSVERKRQLIKNSINWHRHKGTPYAVEEVVRAAFGNARLSEWFEYGGEPYHFKIDVNLEDESTDKNRWKKVVAAINSAKNARSWLEKIAYYYPNIILSVILGHVTASLQYIDAHHTIWNLGTLHNTMRNGEFIRGVVIRYGGIYPDENYRDSQPHDVDIKIYTQPRQYSRTGINARDGCFCFDGSHQRQGFIDVPLALNLCTVITMKNGQEGVIEAL